MAYDPEESIYPNEVPTLKKVLCGNNPLGDWHYRFWKDLDCVCCAFYRGIAAGMIYSAIIAGVAVAVMK